MRHDRRLAARNFPHAREAFRKCSHGTPDLDRRCGGDDALTTGVAVAHSPESLQPAGWDSQLTLTEAKDTNPDPTIGEITLTARLATVEVALGQRVEAWTYNGTLPGPLIRSHVGDRVIVHFTNELPEPTTVH